MTRYVLDLDDNQVAEVRALLPAGALRKKPARRPRETPDVVATVARMIRGLASRAAGDVYELEGLAGLRDELDAAIRAHVDLCRAEELPWSEIAVGLGMTKQGAQQRYGRRPTSAGATGGHGGEPLPFE